MEIFRFDREVGQTIDRFGSIEVVLSRIAHLTADAWVNCMYLGPGARLGYHQATVRQLFLVVQGEGWIRGKSPERFSITAGRAAFWEAGEWHESGTDTGMTAIVVESPTLAPAELMPAG